MTISTLPPRVAAMPRLAGKPWIRGRRGSLVSLPRLGGRLSAESWIGVRRELSGPSRPPHGFREQAGDS